MSRTEETEKYVAGLWEEFRQAVTVDYVLHTCERVASHGGLNRDEKLALMVVQMWKAKENMALMLRNERKSCPTVRIPVPEARPLDALKAKLQDYEYAWCFHCAIACAVMDEKVDHATANRVAVRVMRHLFDVDTSKGDGPIIEAARAMPAHEKLPGSDPLLSSATNIPQDSNAPAVYGESAIKGAWKPWQLGETIRKSMESRFSKHEPDEEGPVGALEKCDGARFDDCTAPATRWGTIYGLPISRCNAHWPTNARLMRSDIQVRSEDGADGDCLFKDGDLVVHRHTGRRGKVRGYCGTAYQVSVRLDDGSILEKHQVDFDKATSATYTDPNLTGKVGEEATGVWHYSGDSPGKAKCGMDEPNMQYTQVQAHVTCPACLSAIAQPGMNPSKYIGRDVTLFDGLRNVPSKITGVNMNAVADPSEWMFRLDTNGDTGKPTGWYDWGDWIFAGQGVDKITGKPVAKTEAIVAGETLAEAFFEEVVKEHGVPCEGCGNRDGTHYFHCPNWRRMETEGK